MSTRNDQMKLGVFLPGNGHHVAAWRHPQAQADGGLNFAHYRELARTAEDGKFDMIFLADDMAVWGEQAQYADALRRSGQLVSFEPLTLLSALAVVTEHIGLVATASTTYNEPYHIARKYASLDYLSAGRAGWNVVTSMLEAEAHNFNREHHMDHALRYQRARECVQVVMGLWDSWGDEAFLYDKATGVCVDLEQMHVLNHQGEHFQVRGPLNVARPPQGYPVIVQAGASRDGQDFAAQTAEVVFTAQSVLEDARAFYRGLKGQLARYGRQPAHLKIMPGVLPVVGRTEAEARETYEQLQALVHPSVGLAQLSRLVGGVDLSEYPLDGPLPELPETNLQQSRLRLLQDLAQREHLTIRQLYLSIAGTRGHRMILGNPEQVADQLEEWFLKEAADGFNIMPPYLPGGLQDFVDLVIPVLQKRGLFRREYEGQTLRSLLGLPRPGNQFFARV
ncbi:MAG TPA: LLM class flavin-dependent oxidoreductase [Ktedonobacteraceae bacterium]